MPIRLWKKRRPKSAARVAAAEARPGARRSYLPAHFDVQLFSRVEAFEALSSGKLPLAEAVKKAGFKITAVDHTNIVKYKELLGKQLALAHLKDQRNKLANIQRHPYAGIEFFPSGAKLSQVGSSRRFPFNKISDKAVRLRKRFWLRLRHKVNVYKPDGSLAMTLRRGNVGKGLTYLDELIGGRAADFNRYAAEYEGLKKWFDERSRDLAKAQEEAMRI